MEIVRNSFLFLFSDVLLEKCEGFLELYKFPGKKERKKKNAHVSSVTGILQRALVSPAGSYFYWKGDGGCRHGWTDVGYS